MQSLQANSAADGPGAVLGGVEVVVVLASVSSHNLKSSGQVPSCSPSVS